MPWYEVVFGVFLSVFFLVTVFVLPFLVVEGLDKLRTSIRRKRHPEYFKYWDEAKALSFENGRRFSEHKKRLDYYLKLYNDGIRDGECTEECYTEQMNKHMAEYLEVCRWFREESEKTKELLLKADLYAKEHNLGWGIIYDTKCK